MPFASGSTPTTSSTPAGMGFDRELEAGLAHPYLPLMLSTRLSFPFPAVHLDSPATPTLERIPSTTPPPASSQLPPSPSGTGFKSSISAKTPSTSIYSTPLVPALSQPPPSPSGTGSKSSLSAKTPSTSTYSTLTGSTTSTDPAYDRLVHDYRVIAQSMHAYRHLSIFRRFGRLSMVNLLSYQKELAEIEEALRTVDREEYRLHVPQSVEGDSTTNTTAGSLKETRIKLTCALRETLKSYYEALLLQEQVFTALDPPRGQDAQMLAALDPPLYQCHISPVGIFGHAPAADMHADDLVALGLGGRDSLEKLVGRWIPALFPGRNPSVEDVRLRNRSSRDIASILSPFTRRVTRLVISIATVALMLGPMAILQEVTSDRWKLVCISGFTVALAIMVALGTRGRGEAIVMVIAAYAAVLAVFVQNDGAGVGGCKV